MHEGGGRWVGSNKVVELKKKKKRTYIVCQNLFQSAGFVYFFFPEGLIFIIFFKKFAEQIKSVNWN